MPPPITSRRTLVSASSRAPVESMMRGSLGRKGSEIASEPAAMMACAKRSFSTLPAELTSITCGLRKRPVPRTTSTLRCLASAVRPPVRRATTLDFHARSLGRSICGAAKLTPFAPIPAASSITLAACSRALEGMQPTFKHTPPSVSQRSISVTLSPRSAARNAAV